MQQAGSSAQAYSPSTGLADIAARLAAGSQFEDRAWECLRSNPAQPELLMLIAGSRQATGDMAGARAVLEDAARLHPRIASIQFELGVFLSRVNEHAAAAEALSRAASLAPGYPDVWRKLGDALTSAGRTAAGAEAYARHFSIALREPAMIEKAAAEADGGRLTAVLASRPTDVATSLLLADLELRLNRPGQAERRLTETLRLAPGFALARYTLALSLYGQRKLEEALRELDVSLEEDDTNLACLNLKALCLLNLGQYASAIAAFERLFAQDSTLAPCWAGYGYALKTVRRFDEAVAALRKALALDPALGEAWWQLANLKTFRFAPAERDEMRRQLAKTGLSQDNRAQLHFALGKALEDASDFPASFEQYAKGNAVRRQALDYHADRTTTFVQKSIAAFTPEFFHARDGVGCTAPDPIFIVGLTRSGSTLIEQILATHPAVEGTKELPVISSLVAQVRQECSGSYPECLEGVGPDRLKQWGEAYVARTRVHRTLGRPLFIDKMPSNFLHLGFIHLILPNARIIDARRHPLACGFANFKQYFAHGQEWSYDLTEIGRYYRDYVAMLDHFDVVLPGRVHRLTYEALVTDTENEVRRLLAYCGIPFDPACLRFYENDRAVFTASAEQVRRPIFPDAVAQWKNYESWLGPLRSVLGNLANEYPTPAASI